MIKDKKDLEAKLKNLGTKPAPQKVTQKVKDIRHLIVLTTEEKYKVECVLFYSLPTGTKQTIEYDKKDISQELLDNIQMAKTHIGYIFFSKGDGQYIPIKEFIVTDIKDNGESYVADFLVGEVETPESRRKHTFKMNPKDTGKLVFMADLL